MAPRVLNGGRSKRSLVHERLQERRAEIGAAIENRVFSLADPAEVSDPAYTAGLRDTVSVAIDFALEAILEPAGQEAPIPPSLFVQAREAARAGVSLDTVLRRYFAGYALLSDYVLQESEGTLSVEEAQRVCRIQATLFDRALEAITVEYKRHAEMRIFSLEHRKAERVGALLAGKLVEPGELGYDVDGRWHLGAIAKGPDARSALRDLTANLDCGLLVVDSGESTWAWLGSRHRLEPSAVVHTASANWPSGVALALGESGEGIAGWRLTHRQAKAAIAIVPRQQPAVVRYGEVALLCTALADDVLVASLKEIYLNPLRDDRDGGRSLRKTLRAYFASERNVSSAAAMLGVNRNTVTSRLQAVSERLGRSVVECSAELEMALLLEEFDRIELDTLPGRASPFSAY